jgi:hypothetical protein
LVQNAIVSLRSARIIERALRGEAKEWMNVFTLHYDALRLLAEAVLYLDSRDAKDHRCLFAAVAAAHSELDFPLLDRLRRLRNGINYYGNGMSRDEWRSVKTHFERQIRLLQDIINSKILLRS